MANSQSREDKEHFFTNLEKLCESESETDHEDSIAASSQRLLRTDLRSHHIITKPKGIDAQSGTTSHHKPTSRTTDLQNRPRSVRSDQQAPAYAQSFSIAPIDAVEPMTSLSNRRHRKRSYPDNSNGSRKASAKKVKGDLQLVSEKERIFKDLVFFFVPNDEIAKPRKMRIQKAREHGAEWSRHFDRNVTHVIVESSIGYVEAAKAFPNCVIPNGTILVKPTWLTESLGSMFLRDTTQSRFQLNGHPPPTTKMSKPFPENVDTARRPRSNDSQTRKRLELTSELIGHELLTIITEVKEAGPMPADLDHEDAESFSSIVSETSFDSRSSTGNQAPAETASEKYAGFHCMQRSAESNDCDNPNAKTITILQEMATYYDQMGDHWRTTAYRKAIGALRKQSTLIATREQAVAIPQVGARLAEKIEEIVTTNRLRRLESAKDDPDSEALRLFMGIYDVGLRQASQWVAQGHRTLSDLIQNVKLSSNQRIGIVHYDDFQQRIPRQAVVQHAVIVQQACHSADKDLQVIIGGSYRRGGPDSGDIDLLVTKSGADMSHIRTLLNSHVVPSLTASGFLKCALVSSHSHTSGSKWHGACCLPDSSVWRRIDLLFVPGDELGAALVYFTGNDIFNRSMRLLASRKGMRLNQHGLYKDVMRGQGRVKMTEGTLLEAKNEKRIFQLLGVPWREPWERKC